MHIKKLIIATLMLWLGLTLTWANPQTKNELYLVTDFTYSSDAFRDFGSIQKNILIGNEILKKYGFPFSHTVRISQDNNTVTYFYKLRNYGDFDALTRFWDAFPRRAGADFNRFLAACGDISSAFSSIWDLRQDLSYTSTNRTVSVGLAPVENFTVQNLYFFKATEQARAEAFFQDLKKLHQSSGFQGEYRVLLSSLGADRLCYSLEYSHQKDPGKPSGDKIISEVNIPNLSQFGDEGQKTYQALISRVEGVLNKTEVKKAQWRPDLYLKAPSFRGPWRSAVDLKSTRITGTD